MRSLEKEVQANFEDAVSLLRFLDDFLLDGFWLWDVKNRDIEFFSAKFWEVLGYDPASMSNSPSSWMTLIEESELKRLQVLINFTLQNPESQFCELVKYLKSDGSFAWIRCVGKVICDDLGEPAYFLGIHQDITKEQISDKGFDEWIRNSNVPVSCHDLDGKYLWVNWEFSRIFGYSHEEIKGKDPFEYVHPADKASTKEAMKQLVEKKFLRAFKNRLIKADNYFANVEWSCDLIQDRVYCILKDISEETKLKKIAQQKQQYDDTLRYITSTFLAYPDDKIEEAINESLSYLGRSLGVDRTYIFEYNKVQDTVSNTYEWCAEGISPEIDNLKDVPFFDLFPEWANAHVNNEVYYIPNVPKSPVESERKLLEPQGIKSLITLPLMNGSDYIGFVGLDSVQDFQDYSYDEQLILKVYANIILALFLRRSAKMQLERIQRLEKLIEDDTKVGAWELDVRTHKSYWSQGVYKIHEVEEDAGFQTTLANGMHFYLPEDRDIIVQAIQDAIVLHKSFDIKARFITAKGKQRWVRATGKPFVEHGEVIKIVGTFHDITEAQTQKSELSYQNKLNQDLIDEIDGKKSLGIVHFNQLNSNLSLNKFMCQILKLKKENELSDIRLSSQTDKDFSLINLLKQAFHAEPGSLDQEQILITYPVKIPTEFKLRIFVSFSNSEKAEAYAILKSIENQS